MSSFEEYSDLGQTGYQGGGEPTAPEDEFFHSVYVSGKSRKNHLNIVEELGKLQVRGVEYNMDEVHMVITHTKDLLAKIKSSGGRDNIECFSYKEGQPPWYGTSRTPDGKQRICPITSAERAANPFCSECKTQILVAGIYCNENGNPILTEDKKPIFIFIRGKGMRFSNVSDYLNDRYQEDLTPIFEPVTEQSKDFEKRVVNNKRFVTKITKGERESSFGNTVFIFNLSKGIEIPKEAVLKILKLSKETLSKFNDKFDWSKGKQTVGYSKQPAEGVLEVGDDDSDSAGSSEQQSATTTNADKTPPPGEPVDQDKKVFSFDDIEF